MGGGGWRQGVGAAELENLVLWPTMALVDRIHPDQRRGSWPPLVSSSRVFAYELTMHALFGVVLGLLHPAAVDTKRARRTLSDLTRRHLSSAEADAKQGEPRMDSRCKVMMQGPRSARRRRSLLGIG